MWKMSSNLKTTAGLAPWCAPAGVFFELGLSHLVFLEQAFNALCEARHCFVLLGHHLVDVNASPIHNDAMFLCILLDLMHEMA